MRIKKLEIRGFKTFADNTEMEFTPGITAVVGPNGSGKSNISDAIAWVMGESNVRNLRAVRTEDVIFNGSSKRKALGFAEVSLTLDNDNGRLPIGFNEVTVTRRAFRSGDSEYFINKVPCRLRDIYELFLDSGAGRGAYSMVSQGEIDELLTGKPQDRRELLEEAAGVKKYRHRRHETNRKLQHTQDNLSRVHDIMQELQDQMEPLADQAEQAIRYKELVDRLKEIEVGLLVSKVQKLDEDITSWHERDRELKPEIEAASKKIEELDAREQKTSADLKDAQTRLEAAHSQFSSAQSRAERLRSDLALAEARKQSVEETRKRLQEEISGLQSRQKELEERSGVLVGDLKEAQSAKEMSQTGVQRLQSEVSALNSLIVEKEKELSQQESGARGLAEDKAAQKSRLESAHSRTTDLKQAIEEAEQRLEQLAQRRHARIEEAEKAAQEAEEQRCRAREIEVRIQEIQSQRSTTQKDLESANAELEKITRTLMEQGSRLKMLKQMHDAREGFFAGVRAVMTAAKKGDLKDEYAVVADILDVPSDLDQAIEAALGSALQDIATHDFEAVRKAIDYLKQNNLGRATFLPMDRLDRQDIFTSDRMRGASGMLGCAYDLVKFDSRYDPVVRLLLGRVLVAKDLQSAADAAQRLRGWSKIVTPDGELLLPSGAVTGGSRQKKGPGLTERKREISDLSTQIRKCEQQKESAQNRVEQVRSSIENLSAQITSLQAEVEETRVTLAKSAGAKDAAASSLRELEESRQETLTRLETSKQQVENLTSEISTLEAMLSNSDAAGGELEAMLRRQKDELAAMQEQRSRLASELQEASSNLSALQERERSAQRAQFALEEDLKSVHQMLASRQQELASVNASGEDSGPTLEDLANETEEAFQSFEETRITLMTCQSTAQEKARIHDDVVRSLQQCRQEREELSMEMHEIEISLARAETEITQSLQRLWEDYEITRQDAITWPEPLLIKHGTAAEVGRLRREIRSMGEVNTGAVAEFERIRERWEFLANQRADLEEARDSLLQAIREIDDSTREMFMSTFEEVNMHFSQIFTLLFGGGVARLELTDPDNLLETGIEVFAQPPGKMLQNMDLLSGGEKALTAQALLFALMRVKPSPFCVLDEVDAPLDDANVVRFANLVREYARESQFIVITHNRATMEAADVLYGVTMHEPGISSLVSAKLTDY